MSDELKLPPSKVATGKGDAGTTGLLFGGDRISKDDVRTEAYGTVDEATAALGMARAELIGLTGEGIAELDETILSIQRDLFVIGAELATNPDAWNRLEEGRTKVSPKMLARINALLAATEAVIEFPKDFVIPGSSKASSAIELARTIIRRAERWCVTLGRRTTSRRTLVGVLESSRRSALATRASGGEARSVGNAIRFADARSRLANSLGELRVAKDVTHTR